MFRESSNVYHMSPGIEYFLKNQDRLHTPDYVWDIDANIGKTEGRIQNVNQLRCYMQHFVLRLVDPSVNTKQFYEMLENTEPFMLKLISDLSGLPKRQNGVESVDPLAEANEKKQTVLVIGTNVEKPRASNVIISPKIKDRELDRYFEKPKGENKTKRIPPPKSTTTVQQFDCVIEICKKNDDYLDYRTPYLAKQLYIVVTQRTLYPMEYEALKRVHGYQLRHIKTYKPDPRLSVLYYARVAGQSLA